MTGGGLGAGRVQRACQATRRRPSEASTQHKEGPGEGSEARAPELDFNELEEERT